MMRCLIAAAACLALAPSTAEAHDCAATCGDICYAPEVSAFYRVEVIETTGFTSRVRVIERLGVGDPTVGAATGEELANVYSQVELAFGDHAFITIAKNADAPDQEYLWSSAWPIRNGNIVCDDFDPEVPLEQFVAMAEDDSCARIAEDLDVSNECSDTQASPGCANAASGAVGAPLGLMLIALRRRRRSIPLRPTRR